MENVEINLDAISCSSLFNDDGARALCSNYGKRPDLLSLRVIFGLTSPENKYRVDYVDIHSFEILERLVSSEAQGVGIHEVFVIRPEKSLPEHCWSMDRLINISVNTTPEGSTDWFCITASGKTVASGLKGTREGQDIGPPRLIFERH